MTTLTMIAPGHYIAKGTPQLSSRAKRALDVLKAGGYFRKQLERGFRGREQFQTRLRAADRSVIPGIGFSTLEELKQAGLVRWRDCPSSSIWPEEYELRKGQ